MEPRIGPFFHRILHDPVLKEFLQKKNPKGARPAKRPMIIYYFKKKQERMQEKYCKYFTYALQ